MPKFPQLRAAVAFGAALGAAQGAWAQNSATARATSQISEPASIGITQNLTFNIGSQALATGLTITSSAVNGLNANILLGGAVNGAVSLSVPASINVVRVDGVETITVRTVGTVTNVVNNAGPTTVTGIAAGGPFDAPVTVVGVLDNGVLSFSIGGAVTAVSSIVPGDYQGVLTVVAQYN